LVAALFESERLATPRMLLSSEAARFSIMQTRLSAYALLVLLGAASLAAQVQGVPPPKAVPPPKSAPAPQAVPAAQAAQSDLSVTVTYTGKGKVDAQHNLQVFLFSDPNFMTGNIQPLALKMTDKSGGVVTFKGVMPKTVYICAIYNETGNYDGRSGPPPAGTPIGIYRKPPTATAPTSVTPGPDVKVNLTFNDAKRYGQ